MEVLLASESGVHGSYVKKEEIVEEASNGKFPKHREDSFEGCYIKKRARKEGRTVIEQRFLVSQNQEKPTK